MICTIVLSLHHSVTWPRHWIFGYRVKCFSPMALSVPMLSLKARNHLFLPNLQYVNLHYKNMIFILRILPVYNRWFWCRPVNMFYFLVFVVYTSRNIHQLWLLLLSHMLEQTVLPAKWFGCLQLLHLWCDFFGQTWLCKQNLCLGVVSACFWGLENGTLLWGWYLVAFM